MTWGRLPVITYLFIRITRQLFGMDCDFCSFMMAVFSCPVTFLISLRSSAANPPVVDVEVLTIVFISSHCYLVTATVRNKNTWTCYCLIEQILHTVERRKQQSVKKMESSRLSMLEKMVSSRPTSCLLMMARNSTYHFNNVNECLID